MRIVTTCTFVGKRGAANAKRIRQADFIKAGQEEVIILSIGWGNVQALRMFFKRCGYSVGTLDLRTTEPPSDIDVLVVPGVGSASAFGGLCEISRRRLIATLQKAEKVGVFASVCIFFSNT